MQPIHGARHKNLKAWLSCHELYGDLSGNTQLAQLRAVRTDLTGAAISLLGRSEHCGGCCEAWNPEYRSFLDISVGSLSELSYILQLARELGYLKPEAWGQVEALRDHAGRLTWVLYRAVAIKAA